MSIPPSITFKNGRLYYTEDLTEKNPKPIKVPIVGPGSFPLRQVSKWSKKL